MAAPFRPAITIKRANAILEELGLADEYGCCGGLCVDADGLLRDEAWSEPAELVGESDFRAQIQPWIDDADPREDLLP
jgi:hypothetical protein